jgi:hypothetical protein
VIFGGVTGLFLTCVVQKKLAKSGDYRSFDLTCKIILTIGFVSSAILGILGQIQLDKPVSTFPLVTHFLFSMES